MDPISHAALGAAVSYSLFGAKRGRRVALVGALAAMSPDLDVFFHGSGDATSSWVLHRHFTHSLFFAPFGGMLCAAILCILPWGRFYWKDWLKVCIASYATHSWLDVFTSYGTLWFWPLTDQRIALDWGAIVDPIYTLIVVIALILSIRRRIPKVASIGLAVSTAYLAFGGLQHWRAANAQAFLVRMRGASIEHARVMPLPGSNVLWRSIYRTRGRVYSDGIRTPWTGATQFMIGDSAQVAQLSDLPAEVASIADAQRQFEVLRWFSDGFIVPIANDVTAFGDARMTGSFNGVSPLWGLQFETKPPFRVSRWRSSIPMREKLGELVRTIFRGFERSASSTP